MASHHLLHAKVDEILEKMAIEREHAWLNAILALHDLADAAKIDGLDANFIDMTIGQLRRDYDPISED